MSVSLTRGQKIALKHDGSDGIRRVMVGLCWNAREGNESEIDCDVSVILCKNGKLVDFNQDVVYYNNLHHASGAISHQGDNFVGGEDGDDEQIYLDLATLGKEYDRVVFVGTIYHAAERKQHFGLIDNAIIRVCDIISNVELCKYNLTDDYSDSTAVIVGEILREPDGNWVFRAVGEGTHDDGIMQVSKRYC